MLAFSANMECAAHCALRSKEHIKADELVKAAEEECPACKLITTSIECYLDPLEPPNSNCMITGISKLCEWGEHKRFWTGDFGVNLYWDFQTRPMHKVFDLFRLQG